MSQAKSVDTTGAPGDDPGRRLLTLAQQEADRRRSLQKLRRLRIRARDEIARLIAFLDASDPYVMTELEDDDTREDVGDTEPSLGSFDRMVNQEKSYAQVAGWNGSGVDLEQDDCEREDCDPDEAKDQPLEMGGVA